MRSSVLVFLLGAMALSGCARQVPPPQHTFRVTAPEEWTGGELDTSSLASDWWSDFGDAHLDRAIAEALEGNHDLRAAAARIQIAQADARIAGAPLLPDTNLTFNGSRQRQNFIGFPVPGGEGTVLSTTSTTFGLRLNASWEPDVWSRISSGELAAVTNTRIRHADLAAARLSLTGQVAKAWFAAVGGQRQVDLAQATLESFRVSAQRVRARFQSGLRPALDLRLALAEVAQAEASVEQRLEQRDRAVRQLEVLMGRYPSGHYPLGADLPPVPPAVPGGLPSELVHRRPDLLALELQLLEADSRIAQAQAELRPRFSLTSGAGTTSDALLELLDNDLLVWNFVGNMVQPLFNNGRLKAAVARHESRAEEVVAHYESRLLQSYREVESALAAEAVLTRREQSLEVAVTQSVAARQLAEQRYRLGLADIITVLLAQRAAFSSEVQLLGIRRLRLDNRVDLHLALGGGFDRGEVPSAIQARQTKTNRTGGSQ